MSPNDLVMARIVRTLSGSVQKINHEGVIATRVDRGLRRLINLSHTDGRIQLQAKHPGGVLHRLMGQLVPFRIFLADLVVCVAQGPAIPLQQLSTPLFYPGGILRNRHVVLDVCQVGKPSGELPVVHYESQADDGGHEDQPQD